jgi:hypothetical protein
MIMWGSFPDDYGFCLVLSLLKGDAFLRGDETVSGTTVERILYLTNTHISDQIYGTEFRDMNP